MGTEHTMCQVYRMLMYACLCTEWVSCICVLLHCQYLYMCGAWQARTWACICLIFSRRFSCSFQFKYTIMKNLHLNVVVIPQILIGWKSLLRTHTQTPCREWESERGEVKEFTVSIKAPKVNKFGYANVIYMHLFIYSQFYWHCKFKFRIAFIVQICEWLVSFVAIHTNFYLFIKWNYEYNK